MAVNQQAIDRIKLDESFATETYLPFNDCWTVSMDSELMVIDDDEKKFSRFTDDPEDAQKALMVINEKNRQSVLLSIDNKLIKEHQRFPKSRAIKQEYRISFADENNNVGLFFSDKTYWEEPEV